MVTQKATEEVWGVMYNRSAVVHLGHTHDGKPAAMANLRSAGGSTSLSFDNAIILRDIAADLNAAARYIEDENEKAGL
jgi:hypothetical protein